MSKPLILAILAIVLLALAQSLRAQSIGGSSGIANTFASSAAPVGCVGTGFNFTLACNSQYIAVF
jgi:hypothetical protein